MPLTQRHLQTAGLIDDFVTATFERGGHEKDLLRQMADYLPSFGELLHSTTQGQMDELCERFDGFFAFASLLEAMATGLNSGQLDVPRRPLLSAQASNVRPLAPKLTVNELFMARFFNEPTLCLALGLVEERKRRCGLFAVRTDQPMRHDDMKGGFRFSQSMIGNDAFEVLHFSFEFCELNTCNVLINPNNPVVLAVLDTMLEQDDYWIPVFDPHHGVTAFRSESGDDSLAGLKHQYARIQRATTTTAQYEKAVALFAKNPFPQGTLLDWVCQGDPAALDLVNDRLELNPKPSI